MGRLLFNIFVAPLLYFISLLPFWLLYRISDVLFVITYVIVGYRKKVVTENLIKAFPERHRRKLRKYVPGFTGTFAICSSKHSSCSPFPSVH